LPAFAGFRVNAGRREFLAAPRPLPAACVHARKTRNP
jgi:hypothetical protein